MFEGFIKFIKSAVTILGPDELLIAGLLVIYLILMFATVMTITSVINRNKRGLRYYNAAINHFGLKSKEDFNEINTIIKRKKTVITEAWTSFYSGSTSICAFYHYINYQKTILTIRKIHIRRNTIFMLASIFAFFSIFAIIAMSAISLIYFSLPALVLLFALIAEYICEFIDDVNFKKLDTQYYLFLTEINEGIKATFGIKTCTQCYCNSVNNKQVSNQVQVISNTQADINEKTEEKVQPIKIEPKQKTDTLVSSERVTINSSNTTAKKNDEKTKEATKNLSTATVKLPKRAAQAEAAREEKQIHAAKFEQERKQLALLAKQREEKIKSQKQTVKQTKQKNKPIIQKQENLTGRPKKSIESTDPIKKSSMPASHSTSIQSAQKKVIGTESATSNTQSANISKTQYSESIQSANKETLAERSQDNQAIQTISVSNTEEKMAQLSARLGNLRQTINSSETTSVQESIKTEQIITNIQSSQSSVLVNLNETTAIDRLHINKPEKPLQTQSQKTIRTTLPKVQAQSKKTAKYNEEEVKAALSGLLGAMSNQKQASAQDGK